MADHQIKAISLCSVSIITCQKTRVKIRCSGMTLNLLTHSSTLNAWFRKQKVSILKS